MKSPAFLVSDRSISSMTALSPLTLRNSEQLVNSDSAKPAFSALLQQQSHGVQRPASPPQPSVPQTAIQNSSPSRPNQQKPSAADDEMKAAKKMLARLSSQNTQPSNQDASKAPADLAEKSVELPSVKPPSSAIKSEVDEKDDTPIDIVPSNSGSIDSVFIPISSAQSLGMMVTIGGDISTPTPSTGESSITDDREGSATISESFKPSQPPSVASRDDAVTTKSPLTAHSARAGITNELPEKLGSRDHEKADSLSNLTDGKSEPVTALSLSKTDANAEVKVSLLHEQFQGILSQEKSDTSRRRSELNTADSNTPINAWITQATPGHLTSGVPTEAVHQSLPTAPGQTDFAETFSLQLQQLAKDGIQEATLHLNPAEMGSISVQIEMQGQQAQVNFSSENAETRQLLQNHLKDLAQSLEQAGLMLGGAHVRDESSARHSSDTNNQRERSDARRTLSVASALSHAQMQSSAGSASSIGTPGRLDLFA